MYGRSHHNEKWSGMNGDSLLSSSLTRQEVSWSPQNPALPSTHNVARRRESSLQSDTWPSIQSQSSSRWQATAPDTSPISPSSTSSLYHERHRVRSAHPFDDGQMIHRRENEGVQSSNFPHRFNPHTNGTREGALQRLQWRDVPTESGRDHRRVASSHTNHSFSHSPTMPFNSQSYHSSATPTYSSSWTQNESNMMTPTLHPIPPTQSGLSYDGSYSTNVSSAPMSTSEEFSTVDDQYRES